MEDNSILGNKVFMGDINQKMQVIIRIVFLLLVLISNPKLAAVYCERIERIQSRHLIKESKRKTEIF